MWIVFQHFRWCRRRYPFKPAEENARFLFAKRIRASPAATARAPLWRYWWHSPLIGTGLCNMSYGLIGSKILPTGVGKWGGTPTAILRGGAGYYVWWLKIRRKRINQIATANDDISFWKKLKKLGERQSKFKINKPNPQPKMEWCLGMSLCN